MLFQTNPCWLELVQMDICELERSRLAVFFNWPRLIYVGLKLVQMDVCDLVLV